MDDTRFFRELLLLVAVATAGAAVFERARVPAVVSFLVIGAVAGPGVLGLVADPDRVRALAEFGVVFLLFDVGLELPIDRVRHLWQRALATGVLQVSATVVAVALAGSLLGWPAPTAVVVGALVAMSSTAIAMRLLAERDELDSPHGQIAVGILLFQDLCIVPFLLIVPILAAGAEGDLLSLALAIGRGVLALLALGALARYALPRLLAWAARLRSRELFTMVAVLVVAGSALLAERVGLSLAAGAFVGGLVLAASPWAHQLSAEVQPLRGLLLGIFFTAVGMLFDPASVLRNPVPILVYVGGVVVLKTALTAAICATAGGLSARQAVQAAFALAQTGEFSFVLAAAAASAGLLDADLYSVFVTGSIGTLAATPLLVAASPRIARRVARGADRLAFEPAVPTPAAGHVVLIGLGFAGRTLARVLRARRIPYAALEANATTVFDAQRLGEPVVWGDATRRALLARLHVERARLVAVAISDPVATRDVVALVRELAPAVPVLGRTRFVRDADRLGETGATRVVAEEFESTLALVAATLEACELSTDAVLRFTSALRDEGYELLRVPAGTILDPWIAELLEERAAE